MKNENLIQRIRDMKNLENSCEKLKIPIFNELDVEVGSLRPIELNMVEDEKILAYLTKWRRMFMRYFLTQFVPTPERTSKWLKEVVMPSDDRIFFLICDLNGSPVGNFGVCNIQPNIAELDNLIRGEKGGDPKLVYYSELCLLQWIFFELKIHKVILHVFSNNTKTISLHESVGFKITNNQKLWRQNLEDQIRYSTSILNGDIANFTYLEMQLCLEDFEKRHPKLKR